MQPQSDFYVSTGIEGMDDFLGGGWERGRVTAIIGGTGTGKTTLLLSSALRIVHRHGSGAVLYVDTEGNITEGFDRVVGVSTAGLIARRVNSFEEQLEVIAGLPRLSASFLRNLRLLVVDSLTFHYHVLMRTLESEADRDAIQSKLERMTYSLHRVAQEYNIPVVISTWPTTFDEEDTGKVVGGFALSAHTRTHVEVVFVDLTVRRLTIIKHQNTAFFGRSALLTLERGSLRVSMLDKDAKLSVTAPVNAMRPSTSVSVGSEGIEAGDDREVQPT